MERNIFVKFVNSIHKKLSYYSLFFLAKKYYNIPSTSKKNRVNLKNNGNQ